MVLPIILAIREMNAGGLDILSHLPLPPSKFIISMGCRKKCYFTERYKRKIKGKLQRGEKGGMGEIQRDEKSKE